MLLDVHGVADLLGISASGVRKFDSSGRLPLGIHLGRCKRWREEELREWIAAGCPSRQRWEGMKATAGKGVRHAS